MGENVFETIGNFFTEKDERNAPVLAPFKLSEDLLKASGFKTKEDFEKADKDILALFKKLRYENNPIAGAGYKAFVETMSQRAKDKGRVKTSIFFDSLRQRHEEEQGKATAGQFEDRGGYNAAIAGTKVVHDALSAHYLGVDKITTPILSDVIEKLGVMDASDWITGLDTKRYRGATGVDQALAEADQELYSTKLGRIASFAVNFYGMQRGIKSLESVAGKAAAGGRLARTFAAFLGGKGVMPTGGRMSNLVHSMARFSAFEGMRGLEHGFNRAYTNIRGGAPVLETIKENLKDAVMAYGNGGLLGAIMPVANLAGRGVAARLTGMSSGARQSLLKTSIADIWKQKGQHMFRDIGRVAAARFIQGTVEGAPLMVAPQFSQSLRGWDPTSAETVIDGFLGAVPGLFSDDKKERDRSFESLILNTIGMGIWNSLHMTSVVGESPTARRRMLRQQEIAAQRAKHGTVPVDGAEPAKKGRKSKTLDEPGSMDGFGRVTPRERRMIYEALRESVGGQEFDRLSPAAQEAFKRDILLSVSIIDMARMKANPTAEPFLKGLKERARAEMTKDLDDLQRLEMDADAAEAEIAALAPKAATDPSVREKLGLMQARLAGIRQEYVGRARGMGLEYTQEATKMAAHLSDEGRQIKAVKEALAKVDAAAQQGPEYLTQYLEALSGKNIERPDASPDQALRQIVDNANPDSMLQYLILSSPEWQRMGRDALADPVAREAILDRMRRGVATAEADYNDVAPRVQKMVDLGNRIRSEMQEKQRIKAEKVREANEKKSKKRLLGKPKVVEAPDGSKTVVPGERAAAEAKAKDKASSDTTVYLDEATGQKLSTLMRLAREGKGDTPEFESLRLELETNRSIKGLLDEIMAGKVALAEDKRKASMDDQTGVANKNAWEGFKKEIENLQRSGEYKPDDYYYLKVDIANLGLDNLLGYESEGNASVTAAGDRLRQVAQATGVEVRDIYRTGGDEFSVVFRGKGAKRKAALFRKQLEALGPSRPAGKTAAGQEFTRALVLGEGETPEIMDSDYRANQKEWKIAEVKAGRAIIDKGDLIKAEVARQAEKKSKPKAKKPAATVVTAESTEAAPPEAAEAPKVVKTPKKEVAPGELTEAPSAQNVGREADYADDMIQADKAKRKKPIAAAIKMLGKLEAEYPQNAAEYRKRADYLRGRLDALNPQVAEPPAEPPPAPPIAETPVAETKTVVEAAPLSEITSNLSREGATRIFEQIGERVEDLNEVVLHPDEQRAVRQAWRHLSRLFGHSIHPDIYEAPLAGSEDLGAMRSMAEYVRDLHALRMREAADPEKNQPFLPKPVLPAETKAAEAPATDAFGSKNKVFTKEAFEAAKRRLSDRTKLTANLDPQTLADLVQYGGFYFEGGLRTFKEWASKFLADQGEWIRGHLPNIWRNVRREAGESDIEVFHYGDLERGSPIIHLGGMKIAEFIREHIPGKRLWKRKLGDLNLLDIEDTAQAHGVPELLDALDKVDHALYTKIGGDQLRALAKKAGWKDRDSVEALLAKAMQREGYDGFRYINMNEAAGKELSYALFSGKEGLVPAESPIVESVRARPSGVETSEAVESPTKVTKAPKLQSKTPWGKAIAKYVQKAVKRGADQATVDSLLGLHKMAEEGQVGSRKVLSSTTSQGVKDLDVGDEISLVTPRGEVEGIVLAISGRKTKGEVAKGELPGRRILIVTPKGKLVKERISDVVSFGPKDVDSMVETLARRAAGDSFVEVPVEQLARMTSGYAESADAPQEIAERGTGPASQSTHRRNWLFGRKPGKKGGSYEPRVRGDQFTGRRFLGWKSKIGEKGTKHVLAEVSEEGPMSDRQVAETEAASRAKRLRDGTETTDDFVLEALAALYPDSVPFTRPIPKGDESRKSKHQQRLRIASRKERMLEAQENEMSRLWLEEYQTAWHFDPTDRVMDLKNDDALAPLIEATRRASAEAEGWLDAHYPDRVPPKDPAALAEFVAKFRESRRIHRYEDMRARWSRAGETAVMEKTSGRLAQSLVWVEPVTPDQLQPGQYGLVSLRTYDANGRSTDLGLLSAQRAPDHNSLVFRQVDEAGAQALLQKRGIDADPLSYVEQQRRARIQELRKGAEDFGTIKYDKDGDPTTAHLANPAAQRRLNYAVHGLTEYAQGHRTRKQMLADGFRVEHLDAVDAWVQNYDGEVRESSPESVKKKYLSDFYDWMSKQSRAAVKDAVDRGDIDESAINAGEDVAKVGYDREGAQDINQLAGETLAPESLAEQPDGLGIVLGREARMDLDPVTGGRIVKTGKGKETHYVLRGGPRDGTTLMSGLFPFVPGTGRAIAGVYRTFGSAFDKALDWGYDSSTGVLKDIGQWMFEHVYDGLQHLPGFDAVKVSDRMTAMKEWAQLTFTELDPDGSIRENMNDLHGRRKLMFNEFMETIDPLTKLGPEEILRHFVGHDAGNASDLLGGYQKFVDTLLDKMVDHGWLTKEQADKTRGRYIPRSRWLWNERNKKAILSELRSRSASYREQLAAALEKKTRAVASGNSEVVKEATKDAKALERAMMNVDRQIRKIERGGTRGLDRMRMEVRNLPLEGMSGIREYARLQKSGRLTERTVETLAEVIANGSLDVRQPLHLLIDGIMPEIDAVVAADWWRERAADPRSVLDKDKAPKNWVEVTATNAIGDRALEPLIGKAVHPQLMDWYQISHPSPDGPVRAWVRSLENSVKLTYTAFNPANWVTQEIGNSAMMLGAGIGFLEIPRAQASGFLAAFGKGEWGKNFKKYLKLNFIDVPTDADRDFMRDLEKHYGASIVEARHPLVEFKEALKAAMEGKWNLAGQSFDVGSAQVARRVLRVYRMLDGGARIGTFETLVSKGMSEQEAAKIVRSQWDVTNVGRYAKYARRAIFFGNSFASIAHTMARNPRMVFKGTVKGTLGMLLMSQLNSLVWATVLGKDRDELEEELSWSVPNYGPISKWWQTKTAFWTPWGTINLGKYLPLGQALDYIPGVKQIFYGGRDDQGQTFWGDIANRAAGGGNVLMQPASEYVRNRDRFGNSVQHRYDTDNPLGWSYGLLMEYMKNGTLPMALTKALAPLTNVMSQPASQALFVGRPTQIINRAIDSGKRYSAKILGKKRNGTLTVDEDKSGVVRDGWMQYILRGLGLPPQQPNMARRALEEASGVEGVQKSGGGGYELTTRARKDPTSERTREATRAVDTTVQASEIERGMALLGMLRALDDGDESALQDMKERFKNINSIDSTLKAFAVHSPAMTQDIGLLMRKHQIRAIFGRLPRSREVRVR